MTIVRSEWERAWMCLVKRATVRLPTTPVARKWLGELKFTISAQLGPIVRTRLLLGMAGRSARLAPACCMYLARCAGGRHVLGILLCPAFRRLVRPACSSPARLDRRLLVQAARGGFSTVHTRALSIPAPPRSGLRS